MNMIYCTFSRQIRHRFKWRKVGEWVIAFSPPRASPQWGKCRQHSQDHAFTSQLKTTGPQHSFSHGPPLLLSQHHIVSCFTPTSTVQKGFVSCSHNVLKFQLPLVPLSFPVTRHACAWIDTQDLTHRQRTPWAIWPGVLLESPAAPSALHPPLHETPSIMKRP